MNYTTRLWTYGIAVALLLLGSCIKQDEEPTPNISSSNIYQPANSQLLQRQFQEEKYNDILRDMLPTKPLNGISWSYIPKWENTLRKNTSNSVSYFYVPLEPVIAKPHIITLLGSHKYLRFK
ncbi:hypothetical protein [Hymenobacter elongatus]|uniref:Lipoprotein n=1 Tax=Hymenobacter elongatus TaxID=877208 RepID=A0A4Z0PKR5_9BACT|nr:hypothetical protein [Hymenobacter elongatus]TGE16089.1 hypothetical protein E5J99_10490 [Hymenobacter elongatus]